MELLTTGATFIIHTGASPDEHFSPDSEQPAAEDAASSRYSYNDYSASNAGSIFAAAEQGEPSTSCAAADCTEAAGGAPAAAASPAASLFLPLPPTALLYGLVRGVSALQQEIVAAVSRGCRGAAHSKAAAVREPRTPQGAPRRPMHSRSSFHFEMPLSVVRPDPSAELHLSTLKGAGGEQRSEAGDKASPSPSPSPKNGKHVSWVDTPGRQASGRVPPLALRPASAPTISALWSRRVAPPALKLDSSPSSSRPASGRKAPLSPASPSSPVTHVRRFTASPRVDGSYATSAVARRFTASPCVPLINAGPPASPAMRGGTASPRTPHGGSPLAVASGRRATTSPRKAPAGTSTLWSRRVPVPPPQLAVEASPSPSPHNGAGARSSIGALSPAGAASSPKPAGRRFTTSPLAEVSNLASISSRRCTATPRLGAPGHAPLTPTGSRTKAAAALPRWR